MAIRDDSDASRLQDRIVKGVVESLDAGRSAFISAPTGAGKTRMFNEVAADQVDKVGKVLVLAARQNLVDQNKSKMDAAHRDDVPTSLGMDGTIDQSGDVVYCTVQTAHDLRDAVDDRTGRPVLEPYGMVVFDEAHHATEENVEYAETLAALRRRNPDLLVMGASATPPEGYAGLIPELRDADKHVITFEEAVAVRLVDLPQTKTPRMIYVDHRTVDDVVERHAKSRTSGKFETGIYKELGEMRGPDWAEQEVTQYELHLANRRTLGFFDSIKDANAFVAEALERNIPVAAIHSKQSPKENERLRALFEDGRLKMLASVNMISEGYDIDCDGILLSKKTTSLNDYRQIIGREARSHGEEKADKAVLVDLGASTRMHGSIETQAAVQTVQGELQRGTMSSERMLPGAGGPGLSAWREMKVPGTDKTVYATNLDGGIIYAAPTPDGLSYSAFKSTSDRKGNALSLLAIDGQGRGMPTREALADWVAKRLCASGGEFSHLASTRNGVSKMDAMIESDWKRNARSIEDKIETLAKYPPAATIAALRVAEQGRMVA